MLDRQNCIMCGGNLVFLHTFNDFPIYMGVSDKSQSELSADMEFCSCDRCGCVQLKKLVDPAVLYKTPHNPAIGKTWEQHNRSLSDYVVSVGCKSIIDIGGANMKIANMVCQSTHVESYTVCDLSAGSYSQEQNPKIKTIRGYIETLECSEKYDAAILSHTLEHFYSPVEVLQKIRNLLSDDGVVIVSVPNIQQQLIDGFLNAMNFEHTYYINDEYMELIAGMAGLKVEDKKEFSKHNSFYCLKKSNVRMSLPSDTSYAKIVWQTFVDKIKTDVEDINRRIYDKKVYCFGAHIFTQMLISCGLNVDCIKGLLDNDANKIGKFLYGSSLSVSSPSVIKNEPNPVVILRAAQYTDEIRDGLVRHNDRIVIL